MEQPSNSNKINSATLAIAVIISLAAVTFLYFSLSTLFAAKIENIENKLNQEVIPVILETEETDESKEITHTFTIKEFNGKIGIYKDGDFQYQINVSVSTLPEADKKLLLRGIEVSSEQELNDIISCYY